MPKVLVYEGIGACRDCPVYSFRYDHKRCRFYASKEVEKPKEIPSWCPLQDQAEYDELKRDGKRITFAEKRIKRMTLSIDYGGEIWTIEYGDKTEIYPTLRQAIDAAMEEENEV